MGHNMGSDIHNLKFVYNCFKIFSFKWSKNTGAATLLKIKFFFLDTHFCKIRTVQETDYNTSSVDGTELDEKKILHKHTAYSLNWRGYNERNWEFSSVLFHKFDSQNFQRVTVSTLKILQIMNGAPIQGPRCIGKLGEKNSTKDSGTSISGYYDPFNTKDRQQRSLFLYFISSVSTSY